MNIIVAIVLLSAGYMFGVPGNADRTVRNVKPSTPAASVGLQPGDRIIAVNGPDDAELRRGLPGDPGFEGQAHDHHGSA